MLKILIVDDSPTARSALRLALTRETDIEVVGEADSGERARALVLQCNPDVVTMDVYLRRENGLDVTEELMSVCPRPILVVTGVNAAAPELAYNALKAGAIDVTSKLPAAHHATYEARRRDLIRLIRAVARVPVVQRRRFNTRKPPASIVAPTSKSKSVVILGSSTGGPPTLERILGQLTAPFGLPIVVIQHMAPGFGDGFGRWLSETTGHAVEIVSRPTVIEAGKVYVAPDDRHLVFLGSRKIGTKEPGSALHVPSLDIAFETAAREMGQSAVGVVLTGMGHDGRDGMVALVEAGATTLAQRPSSCVVSSMPTSVIEANAARVVLSPEEIATFLQALE